MGFMIFDMETANAVGWHELETLEQIKEKLQEADEYHKYDPEKWGSIDDLLVVEYDENGKRINSWLATKIVKI